MVTLSKDQIYTLVRDIITYVAKQFTEHLANRPEIFTLTQDDYDALVQADEIDQSAVYLIKEETQAAAVSALSLDPESDPVSSTESSAGND